VLAVLLSSNAIADPEAATTKGSRARTIEARILLGTDGGVSYNDDIIAGEDFGLKVLGCLSILIACCSQVERNVHQLPVSYIFIYPIGYTIIPPDIPAGMQKS